MFALHGYVPVAFCQATIPLVKCKSGDLTDTNNYRAIALSNAITKILESLLFSYIDSYDRLVLMSINLVLRITTLLPPALMCLKKSLTTTDIMVATFLPALLTSAKLSIMLNFGCCSAS